MIESPASPAIWCVIPAYQAERTVGAVVEGLRVSMPGAAVLVVDDGSPDRTGERAGAAGARVVRLDRNRGKGAALRAGFAEALAAGATGVLTVDADGQHDTACAPHLVAGLAGADVVVGARRRDAAMPIRRRITNRLSSAAVSRCAGQPVADAQSGYRAIAAHVLRGSVARGDRYEYETEFIIDAARRGFRIGTVPVPTIYGAPSHFREFTDAMRVIRTIWRLRPGASAARGTR